MMDLKIFVLTPDDIRLARRIQRDIAERGRTVPDVIRQYCQFVKPAYDDFIRPTMKHSDIIIPFTTENNNAVDMLVQTLRIKMQINLRQQQERQSNLRPRTFSEHFMETERQLSLRKVDVPVNINDQLPFALVDSGADYGEFKDFLYLFDAKIPGQAKQLNKISTLLQ